MRIPFLGQTKSARSLNVSGERTINYFPEIIQNQDNSVIVLYGTPGLELLKIIISGFPIRGLYTINNVLYIVCHNKFYKLTTDLTLSYIGQINTTSSIISMTSNGTEILIVDGLNGYIYTIATNTLAQISDTDFVNGAIQADFLDGYFIVNKPDTGRFYISASYDGTTWAATDFKTAEADPDYLVSHIVNNRELLLFGENTTENWYNSGLADFPLSRISGGFMEWGCDAARSPAKIAGSVFWLGKNRQGNGVVLRTSGYNPQIISTPEIEQKIKSFSTIKTAFGFTYMEGSHLFYVLTFPNNATFVYDALTNMWHERQSIGMKEWRANNYVFWNNKHIIGDSVNGKIYEMKMDYYQEDTEQIIRKRVSPIIVDDDRKNIIIHKLQIDMETGVGTTTGQGSDPKAMLRWSYDYGHTWSYEHWTTMGKLGEYTVRAMYRKLGSVRGRVFELTIADPIKSVLIDANADIEILDN